MTTKRQSASDISGALRTALRKRYAAPQWALMEEVRDRVGFSGKRSADAIAMCTWEGRGLEIHGFELKASRSDWIRERDDPEKAEAISQFCDRWWIVAADAAIVRDGELPPLWGLQVLEGKALKTVTPAPSREAKPLTRAFLAAMLRRATEAQATLIRPEDILDRIDTEVTARIERMNTESSWELKRLRRDSEALKKISEALGVDVASNDFRLPSIVQAFEITSRHDHRHTYKRQLAHTVEVAERTAKEGREALATLEAIDASAKDSAA